MRGADVKSQIVHQPRDERQLFRWPNRSADADRVVLSRLLPRVDVFERLREIKFLKRVVEDDFESGPGEFEHLLRRQTCGRLNDFLVERGVIPPIGSDGAEFSHGFLRPLRRLKRSISHSWHPGRGYSRSPLTPALSLGERENGPPPHDHTRAGVSQTSIG